MTTTPPTTDVQEFQINKDASAATNFDGGERQECRDFKRNVCRKGVDCKYYHPPRNVGDVLERNAVCHDFQNKRVKTTA